MFAFTEYTMSFTYTLLLVILRTTLGKKKNMHTKQSLRKQEDTGMEQVSKLTYISKNII